MKSIWESRKPATIVKYCSTLRKFFEFCKIKNINIVVPFDSLTIAQYLEHIKLTTSAISAVSNALVSIKWLHGFMPGLNASNDPANDRFLSKIVESCSRNMTKMKQRKEPLSPEMIKAFIESVPENASLTQLRDCLIPVLSFSLLLRHDEASHLNCNHFFREVQGLKILIPSSKTDSFRQGKFVFLSKKNRSVFDLISKYLQKSNLDFGQNHFFFGPIEFNKSNRRYEVSNRRLSYDVYNKIFKNAVSKLGLNPENFGTHSARSGGASCLAPHISQYDLMLSGRWSDPRSIGSYVETPVQRRFEINEILDINP